MKTIDSKTIKWFESEQQRFGTKVALYNFVWIIAANLFKSIGVRSVKTQA